MTGEESMEIHQEYLKTSKAIVEKYPNAWVFKCDANNEAFDYPCKNGLVDGLKGLYSQLFLLECNEGIQKFAQQKFFERSNVHVDMGDIRSVPYAPEMFDVVLDLSTLDHIPFQDVDRALYQYQQILKPGGTVLIICWVSENEAICKDSETKNQVWADNNQYFFVPERIQELFAKRFKVLRTENFTNTHSEYLLLMEGEKL